MKIKVFESQPLKNTYFAESELNFGDMCPSTEWAIANIYSDVEYQEILGFGAAFTESAAYNYSLMSESQKKDFLKKYFSREDGIGYNFGRTHINSCDFSLDIYTYVKSGDKTLETFNIDRDRKYIIPFLKDALNYCKEEIFLFASPWSPPDFMKENENAIKGGKLKEEYKKVWALYYTKYIKAYKEEGINISAISVQNEPIAVQPWESCYYSHSDECDFVKNYLIPALDSEGLSDIKIIIWDHNKERVYDRAKAIFSESVNKDRVWGIGFHWYSGDHFENLRIAYEQFKKPLICTEFCGGINDDPHSLAEKYAREICENFNNGMSASCDWNILLSHLGGPYHNRTDKSVSVAGKVFESKDGGCHAPVLFDTEKKEIIYTPIYYYIGHFSKFVKRGAKKLGVTKFCDDIYFTAFKNPDGEIVAVAFNVSNTETPLNLRLDGVCTSATLKPRSITTFVIK